MVTISINRDCVRVCTSLGLMRWEHANYNLRDGIRFDIKREVNDNSTRFHSYSLLFIQSHVYLNKKERKKETAVIGS